MKYLYLCFLVLLLNKFAFAKNPITVYLAGDSTMAEKKAEKRPETGWGEMLQPYFDIAKVKVENHAQNGRSTRTFIAENRWQAIVERLKRGDYVFIQFGHNDGSKEKKDRYTPPEDYRNNLIRFINEVREKKAVPVLFTPVMRRRFDESGVFYDTHGEYPDIVRSVAREQKVALIDMHRESEKVIKKYGAEESRKLFLQLKAGENPNYPNGIEDNTHFSPRGAEEMAKLAVAAIKEQKLGLSKYLKNWRGFMLKRLITSLCLTALFSQGSLAQDSRTKVNTSVAVAVLSDVRLDRPSETVSLDWKMLLTKVPFLKPDYVIVKDTSTGKNIPSQTVDYDHDGKPDELIFQADFAAREASRVFIIEDSKDRVPAPEAKTYGRYVPERDDDFAWENDRIAFRMYGKDLEPRLVSSGLDLWMKRTRGSIIDLWFKGGDDFYHKDNGTGLDFYSVKKSRGCGGSGIWDGKALHNSRNYADYRVIANGSIRTVFELIYEPWEVNGAKVSEVKRITLDAGQNLNKIESFYKINSTIPDFKIGVGIARHESEFAGSFDAKKESGWMSRWETTKADGGFGCAVVADSGEIASMFDEQGVTDTANEHPHHFMILSANGKNAVKYYAGGGWDKSGDFKDKAAWNAYVENFANRLKSPLRVEYLTKTTAQNWTQKIADSFIATYPEAKKFGTNPRWHYDNAYLLLAILELGKQQNNPKYINYVKSWADGYVSADGAIDSQQLREKDYELDSILPGRILIELYNRTKEEKYKKALFNLAAELKNQPRVKDGGYWHKKVYAGQMWLDGVYMAGPYSVEFAKTFNQPEWYDEAAKQAILVYAKTRDSKTGLMYHGWEETKSVIWANKETGTSPEFWGRAIGWYMAALVDELDNLPANHPKRAELIKILQDLSASLVKYQDPKTGLWYQIVDKGERSDNWHETSFTAMLVYAFAKGTRNGYLDKSYLESARKGYQGLLDNHVYTDDDGRVYFTGTVYIGTLNPRWVKGDYESYIVTARQTNDVKGVGAFMWASLEMQK